MAVFASKSKPEALVLMLRYGRFSRQITTRRVSEGLSKYRDSLAYTSGREKRATPKLTLGFRLARDFAGLT
ncbi:hypothetical protein [Novipirellula caenicola]|uniref:hypothetical protein n=1 Tax=Novipirellula caenicola TaxID=1536901 RepID=UPI0031EDF17D